MSPDVIATHNETLNRRPMWWGLESLSDREPASPEHNPKPRFYWVDGKLGDQPTQANQAGASVEWTPYTVDDRIPIGHRFADLTLSCTLSDPADSPLESGDTTVRFSPTYLEKLLTGLGTYRNAVTIRTLDGSALVITPKTADVAPAYWFSERELDVGVPLHPATRFFSRYFAEMDPSVGAMHGFVSGSYCPSPEGMGTAVSSQADPVEQSTYSGWPWGDSLQMLGGTVLGAKPRTVDVFIHPIPIVQSFSKGLAGVRPSASTLEAANRIVEAAIAKAVEREIEVDDTDGALSFELRLANGFLVIGELSLGGNLHANVYNDRHPNTSASIEEIWVDHLPRISATDLIALF